jgi:large subunit ribosomal protein L6
MSCSSKKPILIPENVSIQILKQEVQINGKYGILVKKFLPSIRFFFKENYLYLENILNNDKKSKSYYGLAKISIQNMIYGVSNTYTQVLILQGIGFKFQLLENLLIVNVGFTHPIKIIVPNYLIVNLDSSIIIRIKGIDKEKVNNFASTIYNIKPPEPYKGKGIFYEGQQIIRKAGKTRR